MKNQRPKSRQVLAQLNGVVIVIACEDTYVVNDYFDKLNNRSFWQNERPQSRFEIKVLPTQDGKSSPRDVLERIKQEVAVFYSAAKTALKRKERELRNNDQYWIVLDRDNWREGELGEIEAYCRKFQNITLEDGETAAVKIHFAHSNPCFALWLWWHLEDIDLTNIEIPALENPESKKYCLPLEKRLIDLKFLIGGKKLSTEAPITLTAVKNAVERARKNDMEPPDSWLRKAGSHVYRIIEPLLKDLQT